MKHLRILVLALATLVFAGNAGAQHTAAAKRHAKTQKKEQTVYVTKTGSKYHLAGCSSLRRSQIPMTLSEAKKEGYTACKRCSPPQ